MVEHNGAGTLVARKSSLRYRNTERGTGDAFLEDLMGGRTQVIDAPSAGRPTVGD